MGKIIISLTIINHADEIRFEDGNITSDKIRKVELTDVLVDTGATTLALPKKYIDQLGLKIEKEVAVNTAAGVQKRFIYRDAKIKLMERQSTFECIELPNDAQPLLGVIPLEMLGIELDLQNQKLKFLPYDLLNTYITVF